MSIDRSISTKNIGWSTVRAVGDYIDTMKTILDFNFDLYQAWIR